LVEETDRKQLYARQWFWTFCYCFWFYYSIVMR